MVTVFLGQDDIPGRNAPVNSQIRIIPGDGSLGFLIVEIVAFVLEYRLVRQDAETVSHSPWQEELPVTLSGQLDSYVFSESGRTWPDVHVYKLADVLAEDNKPFIAMDVLNSVTQIKPDFSDAAIFLGNLAYDAKFYDRAEAAYELAARQGNAESVFGFKNMAYDAHAQKRDDEALRLLRIAQKYFPDDVTVQADILEFEKSGL